MKRLMLICVMMLCLPLIVVHFAFADTAWLFNQFTIMEEDGKYGILDAK